MRSFYMRFVILFITAFTLAANAGQKEEPKKEQPPKNEQPEKPTTPSTPTQVGSTNTNTNSNNNNNSNLNKNSNSNLNKNSNNNSNNNSNKNSNSNSNSNSNKNQNNNQANSSSSSKAENNTQVGVALDQNQGQTQSQRQAQRQQQKLENSGNATLTDVGNARAGAASASKAENGDVTSTISIIGDTNVYEAPAIPVNTAAMSIATACTGAMAGQTQRIGFSQSSVTLVCELTGLAAAQFQTSMITWMQIDSKYIPWLENLEEKIFEREQEISDLYNEIKDLEDDLQDGMRKSSYKLSEYDRVTEIRRKKEKLASLEASLERLKQEFQRVEARIEHLIAMAERHMDYGHEEMHIAHITVTSRSHRIASRFATFAQNFFAPLGFIVVAKEIF